MFSPMHHPQSISPCPPPYQQHQQHHTISKQTSIPTPPPSTPITPPHSPSDDLPSKIMTTAQYLRIHANATPAKLRGIIKELIFVHDDVAYLKRLVRDVGGMDYVFRFLWYDGPVPTGGGGGASGSGSRRNGASSARSSRGAGSTNKNNTIPRNSGRTWIEYCCYHNAHRCLRWIFQEIVRNHLCKTQLIQKQQWKASLATDMSTISADADNSNECHMDMADISGISIDVVDDYDCRRNEDEEDDANVRVELNQKMVKIIRQLLGFPSLEYCGTNYLAVATLRNSHQCLSLLLQYGGLDPNMPINTHGSTTAHLAAWKDHVECLRVLHSGTYACDFFDDYSNNRRSSDKQQCNVDNDGYSLQSSLTGESDDVDHQGNDMGFAHRSSRRSASSSSSSLVGAKETIWTADWTRMNALGDTPLHVAAREGSLVCMKYFLDLGFRWAMTAMEEEVMEEQQEQQQQQPCVVDFSMRNNDGMDVASVAAKVDNASVITLIWETIERLLDASIDAQMELSSPLPFIPSPLSSLPSPLRTSPPMDFWQSTVAYFQPQSDMAMKATPQTQPQTPKGWNRHRSKSEPYLSPQRRSSPSRKPPQSSRYRHNHHQRQCLPHYFPTLNLRNSLEEHNHEMPIHVAARHGNCAAIEALFQSGNCDITARDSLGRTALHIAVLEGHVEACRLFVNLAGDDQFENFDVVDVLGRTPLYIACSMGHSPLARVLLSASNWRVICHERKKSPDGPLYVDVAHQPPFHAAVVRDHVNTVSELLSCGVDVNQTDMDGRTAISAAAKLGYHEMCQMLILHGANVNTRSIRGGPTPFQKAKKYKHQDVADLLHEFGGK